MIIKKFLIILTMFWIYTSLAYGVDLYLDFGAFINTSDYNDIESSKNDISFIGGVELEQAFFIADFGVGARYNSKSDGVDFATVPVYVYGKSKIIPIGIKPYIIGKVGKAFIVNDDTSGGSDDISGGLYFGVGAGVEIGPLDAELLYSITDINDDYRGSDNLKQVSLTIGYKVF